MTKAHQQCQCSQAPILMSAQARGCEMLLLPPVAKPGQKKKPLPAWSAALSQQKNGGRESKVAYHWQQWHLIKKLKEYSAPREFRWFNFIHALLPSSLLGRLTFTPIHEFMVASFFLLAVVKLLQRFLGPFGTFPTPLPKVPAWVEVTIVCTNRIPPHPFLKPQTYHAIIGV